MRNKTTDHSFTIGFLTSNLTSKISRNILEGIQSVVGTSGGNVLCFAGELLESKYKEADYTYANAIYSFEAILNLDGLIVYGGDIGQHITQDELAGFFDRFKGIPVVNIAVEVPGVTNVIIDNYAGMYDLIGHLVTMHGYTRYAFVKGPDGHNEAEVRFKAFMDVMTKNQIPVDPDFITPGDFSFDSGVKSVKYYLDVKQELPQVIVAVDDDTAIGAYLELERRGIKIPEDCAVSGFDNSILGNTLLNPLSTVHQPVMEQGKAAAKFLIESRCMVVSPQRITIPTRKIIRRSCGCYETMGHDVPKHIKAAKREPAVSAHYVDLIHGLEKINDEAHLFASKESMHTIVQEFQVSLATGNPMPFIRALQLIHTNLNSENEFMFYFQECISLIREFVFLHTEFDGKTNFLEALFHQARIVINQISERRKSYLHYQFLEKYTYMGYVNSLLNTSSGRQPLNSLLVRIAQGYFEPLEIKSFYLCTYCDRKNPHGLSRLLFAYTDGAVVNNVEKEVFFPTRQLLPQTHQSVLGSRHLILNPLFSSHEHIGYLIFETHVQNGFICDIISWQYSSALKRVSLFEEIMERTQEAEIALRRLQETQKNLVEAEKMASLGTLVTGVAHEINTPLGAGVTYASFLKEITDSVNEKFRGDLLKKSDFKQFIDNASQASQGILINLKRAAELVNSFKNIAVDRAMQDKRLFNVHAYINEILLSLKSKLRQTTHRVVLQCDEKMDLSGYPGIFSQILLNFIMNSLLHGFESIENGTITITARKDETNFTLIYNDNGTGMDQDTLKQIFDPFFTTKRGQGGSGLGLYIVYNLVTQTLNGSIQCLSELARGTTFTITIPINS